jgi:hypothetical protein
VPKTESAGYILKNELHRKRKIYNMPMMAKSSQSLSPSLRLKWAGKQRNHSEN